MTIKKSAPVQEIGDPAVRAAFEGDALYGKLGRARNLTAAQRKKAAADARRNRVMLDLSPEVEAQLDKLAEQLSVPRSQVAEWVIRKGLDHVDVVEMREARRPSRSMRFEFVLEHPHPASPGGRGEKDGTTDEHR